MSMKVGDTVIVLSCAEKTKKRGLVGTIIRHYDPPNSAKETPFQYLWKVNVGLEGGCHMFRLCDLALIDVRASD